MTQHGHRIALITDSLCDLHPHLIEQYHIYVVSQYVIWGTELLRDLIDIDAATFYERLMKDPVHPKTSQPTPQDFVTMIEKARQDGAEEAVIITLSNQLSGTHDSAIQARTMVDIPVHVHDTLSASMGIGWQVLAAARARQAGGDAQAMIAAAKEVLKRLVVVFTVDTLEYLHKGGRIGGAAKLVGTALNLKPQLYVDHATGRVEAGERIRTRRKALERIYEVFIEQVDASKPLHVAVQHGNAEDDARAIVERIQREHPPVELYMGSLTPVLGVHTGPGTIGLAGYSEG